MALSFIAKNCPKLALLILVGVMVHAAPKPVVLTDTTLIRALGSELPKDISVAKGFWQLVPSVDDSTRLVLLHNGTQVSKVPAPIALKLLEKNPGMFREQESELQPHNRPALQSQQPRFAWIDTRWTFANPLFARTTEATFDYGFDVTRGQRWLLRESWDASASKYVGAFYVGLGLEVYTEYMNLQRGIRTMYGSSAFSDYAWHAELALPGISYTVRRMATALPDYYWLDTAVATQYEDAWLGNGTTAQDGKVLSIFKNGIDSDHSTNLEHRIGLRWWVLRYDLILDGDHYQAPVQIMGVADLPTSFGTWSMHLTSCNGVAAPGFVWQIGPGRVLQRTLGGHVRTLDWVPVQFAFDYIDKNRYQIGLRTKFHFGGIWGADNSEGKI